MLFLPSPSLTFFLTTSFISSLSVFFTSCLLFTSVPVSGEEGEGDSDVQAVIDLFFRFQCWAASFTYPLHNQVFFTDIKHSDYTLGPAYTKEFSLVGKNNVAEKVRVMEKPGLFSKDLKVAYTNICWRYLGIFGDTHSRQISQISQIAPKYLVTLTHSRQMSQISEIAPKYLVTLTHAKYPKYLK